jgi:WD40 repeat protein
MTRPLSSLLKEVRGSHLAMLSLVTALAVPVLVCAFGSGTDLDAFLSRFLTILGTAVWLVARPLLPPAFRAADDPSNVEVSQLVSVVPPFLLIATIIALVIAVIRRRRGNGLIPSIAVGYLTAVAALEIAGAIPWIMLAVMLRNYGDPLPPTPNPTDVYAATQNAQVRETEFALSPIRPRADPIVFEGPEYARVERRGQNLAFNPQGTVVALSLIRQLPIYLIDVSDGSVLGTLGIHSDLPAIAVAFSPDGSELIVSSCPVLEEGAFACAEHELTFWDIDTLTEKPPSIGGARWQSIEFTPDGSLLASHDVFRVQVWDSLTRQPLFALPTNADDGAGISSIAFSPDGRNLAVGMREAIEIWEVSAAPRLIRRLDVQPHGILDIAYSPDGTILCASGSDSQIYVWDTSTLRLLEYGGSYVGIRSNLVFTPDGQYLIFGGTTNSLVIRQIGDSRQLDVPLDPYVSDTTVVGLAISPDGDTLAVLSSNLTLRFLDLRDLSR